MEDGLLVTQLNACRAVKNLMRRCEKFIFSDSFKKYPKNVQDQCLKNYQKYKEFYDSFDESVRLLVEIEN